MVFAGFDEGVYEPNFDSVLLECSALGNPLPIMEWYHNEKKVSVSNEKYIEVSEIISPFVVRSRISISPLQLRDSGVYTCKASNYYGSTISSNFVHVRGLIDSLSIAFHAC